jgi:hypothetical protein
MESGSARAESLEMTIAPSTRFRKMSARRYVATLTSETLFAYEDQITGVRRPRWGPPQYRVTAGQRCPSYRRAILLRVKPRIPAATNGTGESVAISALLEPTSDLLRSPVTTSAPSLTSPTVAHRCNSPSSPRAQAAQAPEPRTTSRIPMVRMSSVSVPDPGEKNRPGARIIAAPTVTRAAATSAKIRVDT